MVEGGSGIFRCHSGLKQTIGGRPVFWHALMIHEVLTCIAGSIGKERKLFSGKQDRKVEDNFPPCKIGWESPLRGRMGSYSLKNINPGGRGISIKKLICFSVGG
jgi:hypothetical protein